jgi:hypothetical protein
MMNYVGKTLVYVNLLLSVFLLAWATAIYFQKVDWGWKEPRKELGERVPSEFDKRAALLQDALRMKAQVVGSPAEEKRPATGIFAQEQMVAYLQVRLPRNHLDYEQILAAVQSSPKQIAPAIQRLKIDKGVVAVDPSTLQPIFAGNVTFTDENKRTTNVDQSYDTYRVQQRQVGSQIKTVSDAIAKLIEDQAKVTVKLDGSKGEGKESRPGLFDLLEQEHKLQWQVKGEIGYVRPRWVRELVDSQLLLERHDSLQSRLEELKAFFRGRPMAGE